jgi:uncharacterized protein with ATP-grasp and redox domains
LPSDSLPPHIMTGDPGSYAMRTIVQRKPRIIREVILSNSLTGPAKERLEELDAEMRYGVIASPIGAGGFPVDAFEMEELAVWEREIARWQGRSWLDIPWYFAEAFFYLKVLLACGYYGSARGTGTSPPVDPFRALKQRELLGPGGGLDFGKMILHGLGRMDSDTTKAAFLVGTSLWGNRVDLSNYDVSLHERERLLSSDTERLLVDHTRAAVEAIICGTSIDMILDNAGPELVSDLLLADFILGRERAARVVLHAKRSPFFVSDATAEDVLSTLEAFKSHSDSALQAAGERLLERMRTGELSTADHFFWNGPLHFLSLPRDLLRRFEAADLLIFKGDANYRRLLEDRKWNTAITMEVAACRMPSPFIVLRTMKSEIVVDIPEEKAAELSRADPDWLINGRRGIVRCCRT